MRAIAVNDWGGRDALELLDIEPPPVAPDGVLMRVRAASLNPVDYKVREGKLAGAFPLSLPGHPRLGRGGRGRGGRGRRSPGSSPATRSTATAAGTSSSTGPTPSSRPCRRAISPTCPTDLSFEEAAALPLAALTAHQSLERLGLRGGENLFITGGAGGVGHIAIQLAIARGAHVIASASPSSFDFLRELGAEPVDYHDPEHPEHVKALTHGGGADAAFDLIGGEEQEQAFAALRQGGRLVSIATPPRKREHCETGYVFVRPSGYDLGEHITPLVHEGGLRPHISATFPLEQAAAAHELLEDGHVRGKIVLTIST